MLIEKDLNEAIEQSSFARVSSVRMARLVRDLDRFSNGDRLGVVLDDRFENSCFMKRLSPSTDEIWEIRSRDPQPGLRIFGRFAEQDVFVAVNMAIRKELDWEREKEVCESKWQLLFPSHPPISGASINDYISENVFDPSRIP
ncbi:MAG TPA: hypothetical protein VD932_01125 [Aquabacterium sp.]|nr:hypothetical protein [Aquabacterium sp.]